MFAKISATLVLIISFVVFLFIEFIIELCFPYNASISTDGNFSRALGQEMENDQNIALITKNVLSHLELY